MAPLPSTHEVVEAAVRQALLPFERKADAQAPEEGPYKVQEDLQKMMQRLVGIVRIEAEMQQSLDGIAELWKRARKVSVTGNREYNSGWHTALDLPNLLRWRKPSPDQRWSGKKAVGLISAKTFPLKMLRFGKVNLVVSKIQMARWHRSRPVPTCPRELQQIIDKMK